MPPGTATIKVTRDGHHRFHTKSNTSAKKSGSSEITLAKIVWFRYIALTFFIRYVG
jgi:hypothetical protein